MGHRGARWNQSAPTSICSAPRAGSTEIPYSLSSSKTTIPEAAVPTGRRLSAYKPDTPDLHRERLTGRVVLEHHNLLSCLDILQGLQPSNGCTLETHT